MSAPGVKKVRRLNRTGSKVEGEKSKLKQELDTKSKLEQELETRRSVLQEGKRRSKSATRGFNQMSLGSEGSSRTYKFIRKFHDHLFLYQEELCTS